MSNLKVRDSANKAIMRYMKASECADLADDVERVKSYLQLLDEQWIRFNKAQEDVENSCGEETLPLEEAVRIQTETWYLETLTNLKKHIQTSRTSPRQSAATSSASVRLPLMELPTFSGTPTEWFSFRDIFRSLIHSNAELADSQKLHYLRGCLKGEALRLIEAFDISDANYQEAWELLHSRYQVIRVIIDRHLSAMTYIKKATDDSATAIKDVIDTVSLHAHALKALGRPVQFWDDWLIHLVVSKLSFDTRKQWELSCGSQEPSTFEELRHFLQARCRSLDVMAQSKPYTVNRRGVLLASDGEEAQVNALTKSVTLQGCLSCGENHKSYVCEKFNNLSISSRRALIKEKGACFNCLSRGHIASSCRSQSNCRICNNRHHTALHEDEQTTNVSNNDTTTSVHHSTSSKQILLGTAKIRIKGCNGRWEPARALFDNGSHISLVTEACAMRLGLTKKPSDIVITGIGSTVSAKPHSKATLILSPRQREAAMTIQAYILPKITSNLPAGNIKVTSRTHYADLDLADPEFLKSAPIDVLIGMDVMEDFILPEMRKGPPGSPIAQLTTFGWVLAGRIEGTAQCLLNNIRCTSDVEITNALNKLWEMDEFPKRRFFTAEESSCEKHFIETHRRNSDGRFIVKLPFKENAQQLLGQTIESARRSFLRVEKQLMQNDDLRDHYTKFMEELLQLGHMELATDLPDKAYYMPHRAVVKSSSSTTKVRVVFNASSKSSSGYSLNDTLMVGPQLQQDLFSILIRFRSYQFAMSADIEKMYRQVLIDDEDLDFQRILWRSNPSQELQAYRLTRVTYGVASASYLAVRAMQQAATEIRNDNADASEVVLRDFYMDDLLTGTTKECDLLKLQRDVSGILSHAGFHLRKWSSNSKLLAETLSFDSKRLAHYTVEADEVRALGLTWNTKHDQLTYVVNLGQCPSQFTKRVFLADASLLFDPIGLLVPCTIKARLWFQELWNVDVNWDDLVPDSIARQWIAHRQELSKVSQLKLHRWIGFDPSCSSIELHVFADASEKAYAAAIYARTIIENHVSITLVAARAKVAPRKIISLPRLELCAAHLASKLFNQVSSSLDGWSFRAFAWTDSTITLAWLQDQPSRWSTFIANRVAAIQDILPSSTWSHVSSEQNPADCASRGVTAEWLLRHELWWSGPNFLRQHSNEWSNTPTKTYSTTLESKRCEFAAHITSVENTWWLLTKYSSYNKLKRIVSYIHRFVYNSRLSSANREKRVTGFISCTELINAENTIIRYTQQLHFLNELSCLRDNKAIPLRSNLMRLRPFLDKCGLLRVGGRLANLSAKFDSKYPIILPKNAAISRLIINELHLISLHGGPQLVQTLLLRKFWIQGARNLVRKLYRNCVKCTILNRKPMRQMMSDLPACRLSYERCFLRTAVDYAGPVSIKFSAGRGAKVTKGYISVFICMSTGAMHLELTSDLTTVAFLNAFKRFISRRGICLDVYSDNGTNFVGANKELKNMFRAAMSDSSIANYFVESNITWHFNPPNAPHMGGYWETGVKRMKYYLKRMLGNHLLTFEELSTLLTEIEACLNSRPLCVHAPDITDFSVLTPGHFLIGESLKSIPEPDEAPLGRNLNQRWELLAAMRRHFWKRWRNEYINSLQKRVKWFREVPNVKENDVVILLDERTPPMKWRLGKVIRCIPGKDGLVRVANIRTADGDLLRPIHKLCVLPTKGDIFSI